MTDKDLAKKPSNLSLPQLRMLRNAAHGRHLTDGLYGRSEYGGSFRTEMSLIHRGLILRGGATTAAGVAHLEALGETVPPVTSAPAESA